ncbi:MAG: DedA family protein [Rhodothermales bacterium]
MEHLFADLIEWMAGVGPFWAYLIILVIAYGENVVPPIPGDLVVVFGGYLVGLGRLNFFIVVLLATLGGAMGFMTMYALGARVGQAVLDPNRYRWLPKRHVFKARDWLQRWGYGVVAANRFLSGARSVISLTVGMAHMNAWRTALFATLSAAVWTFMITFAGYKVGENWEVVSVYLRRYGQIILAVIVLVIGFQVGRTYLRRKRRKRMRSEYSETAEASPDEPSHGAR